jgi:predicted RNA binding protein YcfA (HicA-like mRNA interferase family)
MKRIDLIRSIEAQGAVLIRHGGKHDWYRHAVTGVTQAVPRHREIKESLARREELGDDGDPDLAADGR